MSGLATLLNENVLDLFCRSINGQTGAPPVILGDIIVNSIHQNSNTFSMEASGEIGSTGAGASNFLGIVSSDTGFFTPNTVFATTQVDSAIGNFDLCTGQTGAFQGIITSQMDITGNYGQTGNMVVHGSVTADSFSPAFFGPTGPTGSAGIAFTPNYCYVNKSSLSNVTITDTPSNFAYDNAVFNTNSLYSFGTQSATIQGGQDGIYAINAIVEAVISATLTTFFELIVNGGIEAQIAFIASATDSVSTQTISKIMNLSAGAVVSIRCYVSAPGSVLGIGEPYLQYFQMYRIQ